MRQPSVRRAFLALSAAAGLAVVGAPAAASEGGASMYLLGSGGPGAAILPPIQGVFLANTLYYYSGETGADARLPLGGNVAAGIDATIVANFTSLLWVPSTDVMGGTLAVGAVVPFGQVDVDVSAIVTGPRGRQFGVSRSDDAFVVGDPLLMASIGWAQGKTHVTATTLLNIPVGDYRDGELANLAFHRWAGDVSFAATWHDPQSGWDVSGKTGLTFNGENEDTEYETGTEFHVEAAVEKIFSPSWSAGVQAYHFSQISGDSGPGATLGDFKGQVTGVGVTGAYNFKIAGKIPATLRLHAISEFAAKNRPEGDSVFLDFSMPLWVKMPPGAP
jgi:hypothetical protein